MYLETSRLIIDDIKIEDREDYFYNISHDKEVLKTFICKYQDTLSNFDFNNYLNRSDLYAIREKDSKKLIGIFTECDIDEKVFSLEIGYGLGKKYWGNGYMTEVVGAMIDYYFSSNFQTVYASFFPDNIASKRILEKCGMVYSHTNEREIFYLGEEKDLIYYKIENVKDK